MSDDNNMMPRRGGANAMPWVILAVVLLVIVVLGVLFRNRLFPSQSSNVKGTEQTESNSGYQAVFLTNGQVYFGKLSGMTASYATLRDIYYLQVTQTPPPTDAANSLNQQQAQNQQNQQLLLVKLGKELHGPVDEMKINRDQILFYEDMKSDGQVVKKINEYKANPPAENTNTPAANTPANTTPAANTNANK